MLGFPKKDHKYLKISLAIHLLAILPLISLPEGCSSGKKGGGEDGEILPKFDKIEVSIISPEDGKGLPKIKPMPKEKKKKADGGFWGIGIYMSLEYRPVVFYKGEMYAGLMVSGAISGNPGQKAGLKRGDVIFMVDNMPLSDKNDIKGDGPRSMTLHVQRDGQVLIVPIERAWIETKKRSPSGP